MQPKRSLEQRINKVKHIRKNAPQPGDHAFQQTGTIFKLVQDVITKNVQTKFNNHYKKWLTRKNAPNPSVSYRLDNNGGSREKCSASWRSWFSLTGTVIKLFHEDRTINVASRVFTRFFFSHKRKICPAPDGHVFQSTGTIYSNSSKILMGHC
ncbi:hypothetical protein DPMN_106207 [Dreissena polymorpha]|uniref:Uncharacterized protein n=1 Tax=Dreissena polymorpha TaxID=45954 RepID=A0A9D4K4J8_DREPO|nr:hypothetical protein DPMN_106207 [Dreissena polymorpha]